MARPLPPPYTLRCPVCGAEREAPGYVVTARIKAGRYVEADVDREARAVRAPCERHARPKEAPVALRCPDCGKVREVEARRVRTEVKQGVAIEVDWESRTGTKRCGECRPVPTTKGKRLPPRFRFRADDPPVLRALEVLVEREGCDLRAWCQRVAVPLPTVIGYRKPARNGDPRTTLPNRSTLERLFPPEHRDLLDTYSVATSSDRFKMRCPRCGRDWLAPADIHSRRGSGPFVCQFDEQARAGVGLCPPCVRRENGRNLARWTSQNVAGGLHGDGPRSPRTRMRRMRAAQTPEQRTPWVEGAHEALRRNGISEAGRFHQSLANIPLRPLHDLTYCAGCGVLTEAVSGLCWRCARRHDRPTRRGRRVPADALGDVWEALVRTCARPDNHTPRCAFKGDWRAEDEDRPRAACDCPHREFFTTEQARQFLGLADVRSVRDSFSRFLHRFPTDKPRLLVRRGALLRRARRERE